MAANEVCTMEVRFFPRPVCKRQNFRSYSSFVFVGRRNRHGSACDVKTSNSIAPFVKEVNFWDCFPSNSPRSFINSNSHNKKNNGNKSSNSNSSNSSYSSRSSSSNSRTSNNLKTMANLRVSTDNVFCAQECKAYKEIQKESDDNLKRADKSQLQHVTNILIEDLPELFNKNMNYKIYHPNMIFENNIRGTKTVGVVNYMREMFILKIIGNIRFSQVKFTILKITDHPEDGTVRVRWRIVGISQFKNILRLIKHMSQKYPEPEGWYDGFSIFYVRSDGLIHKHVVDKMIPDGGEKITSLRNPLAAKMAFAIGFSVKDLTLATVSFAQIEDKSSENRHSVEINRPFMKNNFLTKFIVNRLIEQNQ